MNTLTAFLLVAPALVLMAGAASPRARREVECPDSQDAMYDMVMTCADALIDPSTNTDTLPFFCTAYDQVEGCYNDLMDQCSDTDFVVQNRPLFDAQMDLFKRLMLPNCRVV